MYYYNEQGQKVAVDTKENFSVGQVKENFDSDPKGSSMSMIYVAIAVVVVIALVGLWWWYSSKENYGASSSEFAGNNPNMKFSQMGFHYL